MIRRKRMELGIVTVVLVLLNSVQSKETCSHRCDGPSGNHQLNYKERTTYSYQFSSDLSFNLPNTQDTKSTTQIKATVFITPQNGCGYVLQLQNFRIIGANGKVYENFVGIEKPVTFQYLEGVVGPEICTEADDPPQSLNVKRAIISQLHLDSNDLQTDVFGVCPTNSIVAEKENADTVVRKERNLNNCNKRDNLEQNFMADTLRDKQILKSVPILNSNFASVHRVNDGIVKHANIYEQYVAAVSPRDNEANATVRSVLQYVGIVAEMKTNLRTTETKSIIFDGISTLPYNSTIDAIKKTLNKFGTDQFGVSNITAQNFLDLVKIMRDSTKEDLIFLYKLLGNTYFRKIYLDAMLRCGTSDALTTIIELNAANELHRGELEILYQGFAYLRYPTPEILSAAANLLNDDYVPKETLPRIGSLVFRYCEQHTCPDDVVAQITTKLVTKLTSSSKTEAVYALKALSNAKHFPKNVADKVFAFAQNPHQHVRVRSAAFDVLANVACINTMRDGLIDVLQNTEEDSEIRIKSYLVLAKCPDQHVAGVIETLVNTESSYQVGGFIASHAKSSRNILSTIDVQKTYPQDPRKYSFTTEIPHNIAGFSGKTGANVIYSQKSFLPRYAKLNVTADMFGSSINVFELEMRQENVDRMLENLMGPVGVFQKDIARHQAPNIDLEVDVSMKLFGSDLLFTSFNEKPVPFMSRMFQALSESAKSKINFELNKQNGVVFIDSQLSFPTSMGFPLRLSVEGVSSLQILTIDYVEDLNSHLGLMPSIDLDIVAGIAMDAVVVETGVKVISKVHMAAGFEVNAGKDEYKLTVPLKQQDVSISHDIYFNQREFGEPDSLKPVRFTMNEEEVGCFEGFADYTGLDLCVHFNAPPPNVNQYLGGKFKAALILNNIDFSHVSLAHRFFPKRSNNEQEMSQISLRVLGRQENTKTGGVLEFSRADGYMVRVTAILPKQNASAEVRFTNTFAEKSISASVNFDKQKFFAKLGTGLSRTPHKLTFNPMAYVAIPGKNGQPHYPLNVKGSVALESKDDDFKVVLEDVRLILQIDPKTKIYNAKGSFEKEKNGHTLDLTVSNGDVIIETIEKMLMSKEKYKFDGHITNNKYPELNLYVNYDCTQTRSHLHNLLEAVHGNDANSKIQRLMVKSDAYFDNKGSITKLENEITYPHGELFASNNFERTNASLNFDVKLKTGANVYGGSIKSNYAQTLLGDTRIVVYNGDQEIETTLVHSLKKTNPTIGSSQVFNIHHVEFTFNSPQTDKIYVIGMAGDTPPKMIYAFKIKDTSGKYVDLSISRNFRTHDLVMYITDQWDIVARLESESQVTKGELVAKVFGDSAKLDVFANFTSFYHVEVALTPDLRHHPTNNYTFTSKTFIRGSLLDSQNSLISNRKSYGKINVTFLEDREFEKHTIVQRISVNTSDIINSGVRDDLQIKLQTESPKPNIKEIEFGSVYTGYYGEYNLQFIHKKMFIESTRYIIESIVKAYPKRETEGVTLEYIQDILSDSRLWKLKIDALDHEEKLLVAVGCDRTVGVNVTSELRTNLVLDNTLKANFSTVISPRPGLKVLVKAWAMANDLEHNLNGEFMEIEKGGKVTATLGNNYSPPITLTANYKFKPKTFDIIWDLRRGTYTLSNALITFGEKNRGEPDVNARGTYDGHTFDGSASITTTVMGTYMLKSKFFLDDIEHTFDMTWIENRDKVGLHQKFCRKKEPCFEINVLHAPYKNLLLLDLRPFGCHKVYIEQASMSNNHSVEVVFDDHTKYAAKMLQVRKGTEYSLITPRRLMVLDLRHDSIDSLVSVNCDFYPNKLQSFHKTSFSMVCNSSSIESKCQALFSDPNLPRSLMVKAMVRDDNNGNRLLTYIFDIFKRDQDKIVLETRRTKSRGAYSEFYKIMSEGMDFGCEYVTKVKTKKQLEDGFEYVYGTKIQLGKKTYINGLVTRVFPNEVVFNLTTFNNQVFMLQARRFGSSLKTVVEGDLELIGVTPMYGRLITRNYASLNFTSGFKNHLDKFELGAKVLGGDLMRVQATKNNTVLFTTSLSIQRNHLDFDYRYNASSVDNLVLKPAKKVVIQSQMALENLVNQVPLRDEAYQLRQRMHSAIPDFSNYLNFYFKERKALKDELTNEPAFLHVNPFFADMIEIGYNYADTIINGTYDGIYTYITLYLYEDYEMIVTNARISRFLINKMYKELVDFNFFLGAHEKDVRKFGVDFFACVDEAFAFAHFIKQSFIEALKTFKNTEVWVKLSNRLDQGSPASPKLIRHYKKMMAELRASTSSVEMINLLNLVEAFMEKKLSGKHEDDEVALKEISAALEDVLLFIYNDDSWRTLSLLFELFLLQFQTGWDKRKLAELKINEVKATIAEALEKLSFPPDFTGSFTKDYIFTFDNNHLTVNTNCKLLLVKDAIDGNFTITADYTYGYPTFTFVDKNNKISFTKDGWDISRNVPITSMYVFNVSTSSNQISIKSKYGAQLDCDLSVLTCVIKVSGYYHGRLQGILGNANRETFDDFMLPNEKTVSDPKDVVKSYASQQCSYVETFTDAPSNHYCEQLFLEPTFRLCSKFVDPEPYKKACDEGVHINFKETEEIISRVYAAVCYDRGIHINLHNETNFIL